MKLNRKQLLSSVTFASVLASAMYSPAVHAEAMSCKQIFKSMNEASVFDGPILSLQRKVSAKAAPRDPEQISKLAEQAWAAGTLEAKVNLLQNVHSWMYYRFPGRESTIDRIMATLKTTVLFPDSIKKPAVIDMFGFPGDGKTDMVATLGRYLGLKARFVQVNVKDGQVGVGLEIFRSLSDVPNDGTQPPISFLVVDEFQKFKAAEDLKTDAKPTAENFLVNTDSTIGINEVQERRSFVRLLYDIFGNASEKAPPTKKLDMYAKEIVPIGTLIVNARSEISEALSKLTDARKAFEAAEDLLVKKASESTIKILESNIEQNKKRIVDAELQLRVIARSLKKDYSELLGPFKEMSAQELVNQINQSPEAFVDFLKTVGEESTQFQRSYSYKQMITFLLGNPEKTINEVRDKNKGMTLDPDQYAQAVQQIDPTRIREELFDRIFGADSAGLRQRLNVDQWSVMPPLNKNEWLHFVNRQMEVMTNEFLYSMSKANITNLSFSIHSSVKELLYREAILPTEGARVYFERATKLTGNFISDLAARMVEVSPDQRPDKIQWSFDSVKREFVLAGWKNEKVILHHREPVVAIENNKKSAQITDYKRIATLTQKAGQIVLGMSVFKSLPSSFRVDLENTDASVEGLWRNPEQPRHTTVSGFVKMAIGANVARNTFSDGFISLSDPSLQFAHEMVRRMVDDLKKREEQYQFLVDKDGDGKKAYAEGFPAPRGLSPELLKALMEAVSVKESTDGKEGSAAAQNEAYGKVLRVFIQDVRRTLIENSELIRSLAAKMDEKLQLAESGQLANPEISTAEIQELIEVNKLYVKRGVKPEQTATIIPKTLVAPIGEISNRDRQFFEANQKVMKAGTWQKLWRKFFKRPFKQRPLDSL